MIDERDVFQRFHSAFDVEAPAGAAQRLRATLLDPDGLRIRESGTARPTSWRSSLGLRLSLRVAAVLLLAVVAVLSTGLFLGTHRVTRPNVPAQPVTSPTHALAHEGPGPDMVSQSTGWAVSASDVWRTTDGGAHWTSVKPQAASQFHAVTGSYFLDARHAWIVGGSDQLITYRTTDGGKTWDVGQPVSPTPKQSRPVLYFLDGTHGWMLLGAVSFGVVRSSEQLLFVTQDGGLHWAMLAINPPSSKSQCGWVSVAFASPTDGWIALDCNVWVMGGSGFLLVTRDGGITWSPQDLPRAAGSKTVHVDPGTGIRYTSDCPIMGPEYFGVATCHVDRLVVFDSKNAMGLIWSEANVPGLLVVTSDGGHNWSSRSMPERGSSISFVDPEHGWATGGSSTALFRTNNGGLTWARVLTPAGMADFHLVDLENGFATRYGSELWRTKDGGVTWTVVRPGPHGSVCFGYSGQKACQFPAP